MRRNRRDKKHSYKIPAPKGTEWLSLGDVRLWLPKDKRESVFKQSDLSIAIQGPGWAIARSALTFYLQYISGGTFKYQIDWVTKIGEGLSKETYRADITLFEGKKEKHDIITVSLLSYDADHDVGTRMVREQFILDAISQKTHYFSIPQPMGIIWHNNELISFSSFIAGIPLELRARRSQVEKPWEIVGRIAAEIHKLPTVNLPDTIIRYPTRRAQVIQEIDNYRKYTIPEIQDAVQWIAENLPPEQESVLIHGDLLGQNILLTLEKQLFVIDWEYAFLGDPAFELTIVTRGVKKPFQIPGGLERLIDSYLKAGGQEITRKDVYVHELLLCLGWYEQSLDQSSGGHNPGYYLEFLRRLLKRVDK